MLKRNPLTGFPACVPGLLAGRLPTSISLLSLLSLVFLFGSARTVHAQALPTAERAGDIDVFGGFTRNWPDYGRSWGDGGFVGGDYLLHKFRFGQPGIEFRYSKVTGSTTNESFVGGGVESHYRIGRLAPYAALLYGVGGISVPSVKYSDSGNTLLLGGGADYPITHGFSARAEYMYGFMHISGSSAAPDSGLNLTPSFINLGVVYSIR
jgi:hypothetical protein